MGIKFEGEPPLGVAHAALALEGFRRRGNLQLAPHFPLKCEHPVMYENRLEDAARIAGGMEEMESATTGQSVDVARRTAKNFEQ
jgi:hypothetical protein